MLFITKNINKKHIIFFFSFKGISYSHKIKSSSSSSTARVVVPTTTTISFILLSSLIPICLSIASICSVNDDAISSAIAPRYI
jgi:hypothetical protein